MHNSWFFLVYFMFFSGWCFLDHCCTPNNPPPMHAMHVMHVGSRSRTQKMFAFHCKRRLETVETWSWKQTNTYILYPSIIYPSIHPSIHPSIIKIIKPNISIYHQIISKVAHANTYTPPRMLNKTLGKLADISLLNLRSSVKSFTFSLGPGPQDVHFPSFLWCTIIYSSSIYQTG